MSCENCVNNIKATLGKLDGVAGVSPNLETKRVALTFDKTKVSLKQITAALGKLGFTATTS